MFRTYGIYGPEQVVNATGQSGGKIGDFDILVDDDGAAYQVRTGNIIQPLSDDYLGVQDDYLEPQVWLRRADLLQARGDILHHPRYRLLRVQGRVLRLRVLSSSPAGPVHVSR